MDFFEGINLTLYPQIFFLVLGSVRVLLLQTTEINLNKKRDLWSHTGVTYRIKGITECPRGKKRN